ncbi:MULTISPECIES: hypothetical protein [Rhizobium]|uniref:hypothetical protein n=1 Tax=Rhizobium TaxID=379 RepID=UPI001C837C97|nr:MULTISPECIES: hypothetical protein [Rhizobium]MBX4899254.1 hypothetical protein [Rhizobium bangladeshense]MBX5297430.1 hypothetical protein [Rhizobium sp. NLR15a]MBY3617471.1 hypothetical protein [Rhizobium bangladeshense]
MTVSIPSAWHLRLANLRNQHPSRMRDIALSHLVDEDFDADDEKNIKELFLFTSDIDTSLLQSFEDVESFDQLADKPENYEAVSRVLSKRLTEFSQVTPD